VTKKNHPIIRWGFGDGYGVNTEYGYETTYDSMPDLTSTVQLLKLHGSTGWLRSPGQSILLDTLFLREFGVYGQGNKEAPPREREPRYLVYPSYIKKFAGSVMRKIWRLAAAALREADELVVAGYSFPPADTAVELLLFSALKGRCRVTVVDPHDAAARRLQAILPDHLVEHRPVTFETWVEQLVTS
jgi:hypothetical protein